MQRTIQLGPTLGLVEQNRVQRENRHRNCVGMAWLSVGFGVQLGAELSYEVDPHLCRALLRHFHMYFKRCMP